MGVLSLINPFGWFGGYQAKLSGGNQPGASSGAYGYGSAAGKSVTPESALRLSTYWACVKVIAQTIGTMPLDLYRQQPDGSRSLAIDHPLYDILRYQPSADFDAVEYMEGIGACLAVWGNSYSLRHYSGTGSSRRLIALEPLRPYWMNVFRGIDGAPVYRYSDPWSRQVDYTADDLLHVRGFGFNDFVGLSPIAFASQTLGTAIAADEAAGSLFRNGMRMSGWFRWKGSGVNSVLTTTQQDDVRAALIAPNIGSENTGKVGVLPGDFDWLATAVNPVDAELLNNRRLNVEEICRGFGVPPIVVGHVSAGQTMWGTGVEHINLAFLTTGLRPYLRRIEAAITRQLIDRTERLTLVPRFDTEELLRTDNKAMAETSAALANAGLKTRNEMRRIVYNLPPIKGGDSLTVQSALIPIDKLGLIAKLPNDKVVQESADVHNEIPTLAKRITLLETKYSDSQSRDAHGRWGSGDGRDAFLSTVKKTAAGGALLAGAALATAMAPEIVVPAAIISAVSVVGEGYLASSVYTAAMQILAHSGLNTTAAEQAVHNTFRDLGIDFLEHNRKAAETPAVRVFKADLTGILDYCIDELKGKVGTITAPAEAKTIANTALEKLRAKFSAAISAIQIG